MHALHAWADFVVDKVSHHVHVQAAGVAGLRVDTEIHEGIAGERRGEYLWLVHRIRISGNLAERVIHPDQRIGNVYAKGEFQLDFRFAAVGGCCEATQIGQIAQVFFLLNQDFLLHILGRGPGPAR